MCAVKMPSTRIERARLVAEWRAEGVPVREIAERLGVTPSTVHDLINDPDRSKAIRRREGYRGTCERCGAKTDGSAGKRKAPKLCASCSIKRQKEERRWTREALIGVLREFVRVHGRVPSADDTRPTAPTVLAHASNRRRLELLDIRVDLPAQGTFVLEFGSWRNALAAAGFSGSVGGNPHHRQRQRGPIMLRTLRLISAGICSVEMIANAGQESRATVKSRVRCMREAGLISRVGDAPRTDPRGRPPALYGLTEAGRAYLREPW